MKRMIPFILALMLLLSACGAEESTMRYDEFESLAALAEPYGFRIGGCFGFGQLNDRTYLDIMARHFNSITCTNETKA